MVTIAVEYLCTVNLLSESKKNEKKVGTFGTVSRRTCLLKYIQENDNR